MAYVNYDSENVKKIFLLSTTKMRYIIILHVAIKGLLVYYLILLQMILHTNPQHLSIIVNDKKR